MQRHQAGVWRYLRYLGADPALAEDLAQEVLVRGLEAGQAEAAAAGVVARWLRTTARNLWIDDRRGLRRGKRWVPLDDVDDELADREWEATLGDDDSSTFRAALRRCLDGLPARSRLALDLRYRDAAGRAQMALALQLSEAGVKQLLRRLRAGLRDCIERRSER